MRDKPLSGWTDISTPPVVDRSTGNNSPSRNWWWIPIHYGAQHLQYYELEAFIVMANHVHLLVLPRVSPSRFLQTLRGYTAREANRLLGRTGQPEWLAESSSSMANIVNHAILLCFHALCPQRHNWEAIRFGLVEDAMGLYVHSIGELPTEAYRSYYVYLLD
jgi:REP element-mobilizing transposase RayT